MSSTVPLGSKSDRETVLGIIKSYGLNENDIDLSLIENNNDYNLILLEILINNFIDSNKMKSSGQIKISSKKEILEYISSKIKEKSVFIKINNWDNKCFSNLLFIISVFSKYEFPVEESFIKNKLNSFRDVPEIINYLLKEYEIYKVSMNLENGYLIPHMKYAEIVVDSLKNSSDVIFSENEILSEYLAKGCFFGRLSSQLQVLDYKPTRRMSTSEYMEDCKLTSLLKNNYNNIVKRDFNNSLVLEILIFFNNWDDITSYVKDVPEKINTNINFKNPSLIDQFSTLSVGSRKYFLSIVETNLKDVTGIEFLNSNLTMLEKTFFDCLNELGLNEFISLISQISYISKDIVVNFLKKNSSQMRQIFSNLDKLQTFDIRYFLVDFSKIENSVRDIIYKNFLVEHFSKIVSSNLDTLRQILHFEDWNCRYGNFYSGSFEYIWHILNILSDSTKTKITNSTPECCVDFFENLVWASEEAAEQFFNRFKKEIYAKIVGANIKCVSTLLNSISEIKGNDIDLNEMLEFSENYMLTLKNKEFTLEEIKDFIKNLMNVFPSNDVKKLTDKFILNSKEYLKPEIFNIQNIALKNI